VVSVEFDVDHNTIIKTWKYNLVSTMSFWNNLHQVYSNRKIGKPNNVNLWDQTGWSKYVMDTHVYAYKIDIFLCLSQNRILISIG
jgi:hypothetical protein